MTRYEFLEKMLEKGKITREQADRVEAKDAAKERYLKDRVKMTKAEIQLVMDTLLS